MALTNLGLALADAGSTQEAVDVQSRAHRIFRGLLGPSHVSTLLAARRLAVALIAVGQHERARGLLAEILDSAVSRAADDEAELARIADDAAVVYGAGSAGS
jgi:hypothetical protein